MSVEVRRLVSDPQSDPQLARVVTVVNRLVDMVNGSAPGRVWLLGDDGERREIRGGASISSNNYPLRARSEAGNHAQFTHSSGAPDILRIQDAGVTANAVTVTGNATIGGTLGVTGATTLGGTLGVTGQTQLQGALLADGAVTLGNAASDVITVTGTSTFAEPVTLVKGLTVDTLTLVVDAVNHKVGILSALPTATLTVGGQVQVTGTSTPSAGAGIELGFASGLGSIAAYDRGVGAWQDLNVSGLSVKLISGSDTMVEVDGAGIGFFGQSPSAQPSAGSAASGTLASATTLVNALREGLRDLGLFS